MRKIFSSGCESSSVNARLVYYSNKSNELFNMQSANQQLISPRFFSRYACVGVYGALLLGLFLRLALFQWVPEIPTVYDQAVYYRQALQIVRQGVLQWSDDSRAPGYPFFLAANFVLSGSSSKTFVRVIQCLLSTATIALIYGIAQLLFANNRRARDPSAVLAALAFTLYPDYIFFAQTLWSETVFVFLTALGLYILLRLYRQGARPVWFGLAGILLGLAVITREMILIFVLLGVPLWLGATAYPAWRKGGAQAAWFLCGLALILSFTTARNFAHGNGLELISWQGGRDFWKYNTGFTDRKLNFGAIERELAKSVQGQAKNARGYEEGLKGILNDPVQWIWRKALGASGLWRNARPMIRKAARLEVISRSNIELLAAFMQRLWSVLIVLIVIGMVAHRDPVVLLFVLLLLTSLLVFAATHYIPRFRLSVLAFYLPYAAFGVLAVFWSLLDTIKSHRIPDPKRLAVTGFVLLVIFADGWWLKP